MKTCNHCGIAKPLVEFPPDKQNRDGRKGKCRACVLQWQRDDRAQHPEKGKAWVKANKEKVLASKRAYREKNADTERVKSRLRQRAIRATEEGNRKTNETSSRYFKTHAIDISKRAHDRRLKDPTRFKAREAVGIALDSGRLVKPSACSACGKVGKLEAHHISYAKEHWLDVVWLCTKCHGKAHWIGAVVIVEGGKVRVAA